MGKMSNTEIIVMLELIADLIEAKAKTIDEAVEIIRKKAADIKNPTKK